MAVTNRQKQRYFLMMKTSHLPLLGISALMTGLTGCTGLGAIAGDDTLAVTSTPPQATVFVMEEAVGQTPLKLSQQTLFPATYPQDKQHLYGQVTIKKAGCKDYVAQIGSRTIARGLDVTLDCGGDSGTGTPATPAPATAPAAGTDSTMVREPQTLSPGMTGNPSAKQRLQRIDALKQEGLIDDNEYQAIRQRILDSL